MKACHISVEYPKFFALEHESTHVYLLSVIWKVNRFAFCAFVGQQITSHSYPPVLNSVLNHTEAQCY